MLKFASGSISNKLIHSTQKLMGMDNASVTHAGILFDQNFLIEAQGAGLQAHDIRVQNAGFGYLVYRPRASNLGQGAAVCAKMMFDIQHQYKTLKYNFAGTVKSLFGGGRARTAESMDGLLDDILSGKGHPFFCSQFVVYVYQFVSAQNGLNTNAIFPVDDAKVPPAKLASMLANNAFFHEAGYLMPGQR